MHRYPILFLNGTSSAGKTSAAKAFQRLWPEPVIYASNDAFIYMFAEHVLKNKKNLPKVIGPILTAFYQSLPNIAACGFPMIVDSVIEGEEWMRLCVANLARYDVLFVGVKCPLEEVERRELARGDRHVGFARWQYERVHAFGAYDFELDTSTSTPEQCAAQLVDLLRSGRRGEAFANLRRGFA